MGSDSAGLIIGVQMELSYEVTKLVCVFQEITAVLLRHW